MPRVPRSLVSRTYAPSSCISGSTRQITTRTASCSFAPATRGAPGGAATHASDADLQHSLREFQKKTVATTSALAIACAIAALPANALDIKVAPKGFSEFADQQLEAVSVKCQGGMMDCDGDRRDYAKKQMENFSKRGTGEEDTTCKAEEPCTSNLIGAAVQALNGMTPAEKYKNLGFDEEEYADRPNVFK